MLFAPLLSGLKRCKGLRVSNPGFCPSSKPWVRGLQCRAPLTEHCRQFDGPSMEVIGGGIRPLARHWLVYCCRLYTFWCLVSGAWCLVSFFLGFVFGTHGKPTGFRLGFVF